MFTKLTPDLLDLTATETVEGGVPQVWDACDGGVLCCTFQSRSQQPGGRPAETCPYRT